MRRLLVLLCGVFLSQGVAMAQFTEHPRYAHIQTKLQAFIQSVSDAQAEYFTSNNKYFQGLKVPDVQLDGLIDEDVNWALKPSDQEASWKDFASNIFRSNVKVPFQIRVDVYESPSGWGWYLIVDVYIDGYGPDKFGNYGSHWQYIHHEGPSSNWPEEMLDDWTIVYEFPE